MNQKMSYNSQQQLKKTIAARLKAAGSELGGQLGAQVVRQLGGQPGNRNAQGHGAPPRNTNAETAAGTAAAGSSYHAGRHVLCTGYAPCR